MHHLAISSQLHALLLDLHGLLLDLDALLLDLPALLLDLLGFQSNNIRHMPSIHASNVHPLAGGSGVAIHPQTMQGLLCRSIPTIHVGCASPGGSGVANHPQSAQ